MDKKALFILIDGLGDVSGPSGELTPLCQARTPTFDQLAAQGYTGLMDPVEAGVACGSDTAHLSILGYDPRLYYRGRGAFETLGTGLAMQPGDIAFKCVFAAYDEQSGAVVQRRPGRNFEDEARVLCSVLDGLVVIVEGNEYSVAVKYATEHRCGVRIRGPSLTCAVSGTDPLKDRLPLLEPAPLEDTFEARLTAKVISLFSDRFLSILREHRINLKRVKSGELPGNIVLFRGPASLADLPTFKEMHGLDAFMIAPTCLIAGIGLSLHMDLIKVPGATGDYRSDFGAKFRTALALLDQEKYRFGFVHVKAADEMSHSGEPVEKRMIIELLDRELGAALQNLGDELRSNLIVAITGDHTTPSYYHHDHTHHPVPFLISPLVRWDSIVPDNVTDFNEIAVSKGRLGRFTGLSAMMLVKRLLDITQV